MKIPSVATPDYLLKGRISRRLYSEFAESLPICDFHCHLSPKEIAENKTYRSLTELMLGGDHYKWRLMRSCGIPEELITGNADDFAKFEAFSSCLRLAVGNPIVPWTAMELSKYFGISEALTPESARRIYDSCGEMLKTFGFSARGLIARSNVRVLCTTDDPADSLEFHREIRDSGFETVVLPSFRPDKALHIENPGFADYITLRLGVRDYSSLLRVLSERMDSFSLLGCRESDHSLSFVPYREGDAEKILLRRLSGEKLSEEETEIYQTSLLSFLGKEYAKRGWAMQLHLGALRNNSSRIFSSVGADAGCDSMNDLPIAAPLARFLDSLDRDNLLPKTVLYPLNPKDTFQIGTMIGNFQSSDAVGKIQLGAAWWFNDQKDGIEAQLRTLGNLGALGTFIGMLTDSRSFVSYSRHDYFRRILSSLLGKWVEDGDYPADYEALGRIIRGICYDNAMNYFGFAKKEV